MQRIRFKTQFYFPNRFVWAFVTGFSSVAFLAAGYYWLCFTAALVGAFSVTSHYGVEINFESGYYKEYFWLLGLRLGKRIRFTNILYLFIKNFTVRETFNSKINSATFSREEFRGYVKFSEDEKVHILNRSDYETLVSELKELAKRWRVGVIDYSFGHRQVLVEV